jgi:hypothetical protein
MSDRYDNVDHTLEAVSRLRRIIREHDAGGAEDTPFHLGIREALQDLDARVEQDESSAA